ncbi:MAG: NAD+ synthase [Phycisphaerae bacterium]|nr:NAD+ synthase [Phycisphaerae bacterium]
MRIALAQTNPVVGDIPYNRDRIAEAIARAGEAGADLVVFSELSVVGYPPRDLVGKEQFVADSVAAVEGLAGHCTSVAALVGFVRPAPRQAGPALVNAAALLADGSIQRVHAKRLLPSYDVFDETRYFQPGHDSGCFEVGGVRLGLTICEDLWDAAALGRDLYGDDPVGRLAGEKVDVIVNMAASPFETGKTALRDGVFERQAARAGAPIIYVNQVGGNDALIFDGGSCVVAADGTLLARARSFEEDLLIVDVGPEARPQRCEPPGEPLERLSAALKLGLRDYVTKCGFTSVVLGLSGGIDSGVTATLAADALGPDNVTALAMPGRYSSDHSLSDAEALANNLGLRMPTVPIEPLHAAFESALGGILAGGNADLADENVQARIRGMVVMAVSNAFGKVALATGNKSELSVGYCTLYGDMAGGLAPIGDVLKTKVFALARQLNAEAGRPRIPERMLTKPPSAELKPDQTDQDALPPYELLDAILARYIEGDQTAEMIVAEGFDASVVHRVVGMVDGAEHKRRQAAVALKVSGRAFGSGRRMPIAQRYQGTKG